MLKLLKLQNIHNNLHDSVKLPVGSVKIWGFVSRAFSRRENGIFDHVQGSGAQRNGFWVHKPHDIFLTGWGSQGSHIFIVVEGWGSCYVIIVVKELPDTEIILEKFVHKGNSRIWQVYQIPLRNRIVSFSSSLFEQER